MNKFFDNLPIVTIMRIWAVMYFVVSVVLYVIQHHSMMDFTVTGNVPEDRVFNAIATMVIMFVMGLFQAASSAVIILGLAEIIKLMQEKKEVK